MKTRNPNYHNNWPISYDFLISSFVTPFFSDILQKCPHPVCFVHQSPRGLEDVPETFHSPYARGAPEPAEKN